MSSETNRGEPCPSPAPLTDWHIVNRIVRAAVREIPGPFRMRLALAEWERIKAEQAAAARHAED